MVCFNNKLMNSHVKVYDSSHCSSMSTHYFSNPLNIIFKHDKKYAVPHRLSKLTAKISPTRFIFGKEGYPTKYGSPKNYISQIK